MPTRPITCGELAGLLTEIGFYPKVIDEHRIAYFETDGDWQFVLPNRPPGTPARELDVRHVRLQLDMRGLMEKDDFDAYFNNRPAPAKR
jgi:hypothetical protein